MIITQPNNINMKRYYSCIVAIIAFLFVSNASLAQNDYIITVEGETIKNITITSFPTAIERYVVNVYNENLMPKYEDLKVIYTKANSKGLLGLINPLLVYR